MNYFIFNKDLLDLDTSSQICNLVIYFHFRVPFYNLKNEKINLEMMKGSAPLLYYDNKTTFSAVQVPYQTFEYAAVFILPHKEVDPIKFVTTFTMDILKEFLSKAELKDIDCQIPTFSYAYSFEINKKLEELGIKKLFGEVDLSKMLNVEKQNLGVKISHQIELEVNQHGTTANGLTVVPVKKNPPPTNLLQFIADRPFLMLIRSINSDAIAFATFYSGGPTNVSATSSG